MAGLLKGIPLILVVLISTLFCFSTPGDADSIPVDAARAFSHALKVQKTNPADALAYYQRATTKDASLHNAWFNMGIIWYQQKEFQQAELAFDHAVKTGQNDLSALLNRAATRIQLKKWSPAVADLKEVLEHDAQCTRAIYNMLLVTENLHQRDLQIYYASRARQLEMALPQAKAMPQLVLEPRQDITFSGNPMMAQDHEPARSSTQSSLEDVSQTTQTKTASIWQPDSAVAGKFDIISEYAIQSGMLDEIAALGGTLPKLNAAPMVKAFPGFPANDPCNPQQWTLPVVLWTTSHYTGVIGEQLPESDPIKQIPTEPTAESIKDYQETLLHTIEAMRLICGIPDKGEKTQSFQRLWAPFQEQPSTEAHMYFTRLNLLLDRYFTMLGQIESDLEGVRETLQMAAASAIYQDELSTRSLLDSGYIITKRLQNLKTDALHCITGIRELGDPPNPLKAQCNARKRHQKAMDALNATRNEGCWVLSHVEFADNFKKRTAEEGFIVANENSLNKVDGIVEHGVFIPAATSLIYERPPDRIALTYGEYNYKMHWEHPKAVMHPGDTIVIQGKSIRTSIDEFPFTCSLTVPRQLKPAGSIKPGFSRLHNIAYPNEDNYSFAVEGEVLAEPNTEERQMRVALKLFAGVNTSNQLPFLPAHAAWLGKRDYIYTWSSGCEARPIDPSDADLDRQELQSVGRQSKEPENEEGEEGDDPPVMTPEEIKSAVLQHQSVIDIIKHNMERIKKELTLATDPAIRASLDDELVMQMTNLQIEQDLIASLRTGKIVRHRTIWEEREQQRFIAKIEEEVDLFSKESRMLKRLPRLAANREKGSYGATQKMFNDIDAVYQSDLPLEERVKRLADLRDAAYLETVKEQQAARQKLVTAEERLWYAEKVQTACNVSLMFGALFVPGGAYVAMTHGVGTGYIEGGTVKAFENGIRAALNPVDVVWAFYDGYYSLEKDQQTGKIRYRGWQGGLENAAYTYVMNKLFEKVGQRMQGRTKGADIPGTKVGKPKGEPHFDAFTDNTDAFRYKKNKLNEAYLAEVPRNPDGSINTNHRDYPSLRKKYNKKQGELAGEYGVIAKREDLKNALENCTRQHEARIPDTARNADGTVNTKHPEYQRVKEQWEGEMADIRSKHNKGYEQRWQEQDDIINELGIKKAVIKSGGKPESIMSDIDRTFSDLGSGKQFINALKNRGYKVHEYPDRWVIPKADTVIWKPASKADIIGSSSQSAAASYGAERGSDKFSTKGGLHYTTEGKYGIKDPAGAVIDNLKKATEAGIGGNTSKPDYHIIGKSVDKSFSIASDNGASKNSPLFNDPVFQEKARAVRRHKTPEEAGIFTFGNPEATKQKEGNSFLRQSRHYMAGAMQEGSKASGMLNAERMQKIRMAEASGNHSEANALRQELVTTKITNEAVMQSLSAQDPRFMNQVNQAVNVGAVPRSNQSIFKTTAGTGTMGKKESSGYQHRFGYGWLLKKVGLSADPATSSAPQPQVNSYKSRSLLSMSQAATVLKTQLIPAVNNTKSVSGYFSALNQAFQSYATNPAYAGRAIKALSGYDASKVATDLNSVSKHLMSKGTNKAIEEIAATVTPLENQALAATTRAWVFLRLPIVKLEKGPLGFSNEKTIKKEIAPRILLEDVPLKWNGTKFLMLHMNGTFDGNKRIVNDPGELSNASYWTKAEITGAISADGREMRSLNATSLSQSQRTESTQSYSLEMIPLDQKKQLVINGKPADFFCFRISGAEVEDLLLDYTYSSEHNWPEGRWKHELEVIRWQEKEKAPEIVVIFSPFSREQMKTKERSLFEDWVKEVCDL
ncbi:tetratricopeptide repeat protein [Desulfogranum japonicum]|uniref:tetratricopeptide repeat protein n=1 Tax=Desulfogranum japonicum TaxID=231447 RepID=UPI0003F54220|nr:hypothetical protein [Desulfogranum japonicum]